MDAPVRRAVEPANRDCMRPDEADDLRLRHRDARAFRQRHRGVLDERRIDGLVVEELDQPLLTADIDQRLGLRAAERAATAGHDLRLHSADGFRGFDLGDDLAKPLRIVEAG